MRHHERIYPHQQEAIQEAEATLLECLNLPPTHVQNHDRLPEGTSHCAGGFYFRAQHVAPLRITQTISSISKGE
ncbi:MAG: hypothetical protein SFZ02_18205 [bacterium]|nr:hypothetical protein [bacterium]